MSSLEKRARFRAYLYEKARQNLLEGNYEASFSHYLLALKLNQDYAVEIKEEFLLCLQRWTESLHDLKRFDELASAFDQAKVVCHFSETMLCALGEQALRLHEMPLAVSLVRDAAARYDNSLKIKEILERVSYCAVDRWHFKMLNDAQRNKAYRDAIVRALGQDVKLVLDIGCGTGLLSLFAIEGGAQTVIMCDAAPMMADISKAVMASNHILSQNPQHSYKIFAKHSTNITVPEDIHERVDLVVTEIFDAALFGEHCLSTLIHAWSYLLHNNEEKRGKVIPRSATLYVCAIECQEIRKENIVDPSCVPILDLMAVNILSKTSHTDDDPYTTEDLFFIRNHYKILSPVHMLMNVDFNNMQDLVTFNDYCSSLTLDIYVGGRVDALAVWFDLHLAEDIVVSTEPNGKSCWEQAIFPIMLQSRSDTISCSCPPTSTPFTIPDVQAGDQLYLRCTLKDGCLRLQLEDIIISGYFLKILANNYQNQSAAALDCQEGILGQQKERNSMETETVAVLHHLSMQDSTELKEKSSNDNDSLLQNLQTHHTESVLPVFDRSLCQHQKSICHLPCESACASVQTKIQPQDESHIIYENTPVDLPFETDIGKGVKAVISTGRDACILKEAVQVPPVTIKGDTHTETDYPVQILPPQEENIITVSYSQEHISVTRFPVKTNCFVYEQSTADCSSNQNCIFLERELIRRLNDKKANRHFVAALRHFRTCFDGPGKVFDLGATFPIHGLLALKLHFNHADLWISRQEDAKKDIEILIDLIAKQNSFGSGQVNLYGQDIADVIEIFSSSVENFDIIVTDLVDINGSIHSCILEDLLSFSYSSLSRNGIVIPQIVDIYAVLIESSQLLSMSRLTSSSQVLGYNIAEHINDFQTRTFLDLDIHTLPRKNLTAVCHVFHLDLQSAATANPCSRVSVQTSMLSQHKQLQLTAQKSGIATAVVFWFDMQLAPDVHLSTIDPHLNWKQAAFVLDGQVAISEGREVMLDARMEKNYLDFTVTVLPDQT